MKKFFSKKFFFLVIPFALFFTLLNRYSLHFPFIEPEQKIIVRTSKIKEFLLGGNKGQSQGKMKFLVDNFLLINTTHDIDKSCLADSSDFCSDSAHSNPPPCGSIVDRVRLINLLKWLNLHPDDYGFVICDLLFEDRSGSVKNDDTLGIYLNTLVTNHKILFAEKFKVGDGTFDQGLYHGIQDPQTLGAINSEMADDFFFSYQLTYQNAKIKSLPMMMYEKIYGTTASQTRFGFITYSSPDSKPIKADNRFIPEMAYSINDIDSLNSPEHPGSYSHLDSSIAKMDLWQAVKQCDNMPNFYLQEALHNNISKKKNIFLGAFSHDHADMHNTLYGNLDGGLILLNIYYSLSNGGNRFYWYFQLFIFTCFILIFRKVFISGHTSAHVHQGFLQHIKNWIIDESPYLILIIMTLVANIFFSQVTNVIVLVVIIAEMERASRMSNNWAFIKW